MHSKAFVLALALGSVGLSFGDVVTFKSGSRLTGTVLGIEGGVIKFKSDDVGAVEIKSDAVATLDTDKPNPVLYVDKTTGEGVVAAKDGAYTLSGKPLDMKTVKAVNPAPETWHGAANLSATAARGNTVSENVTFLAELNRRWEKDRFTSALGYYFAQSGDSRDTKRKSTDRFEVQGQEDHFWSSLFYSYVNGKYEFDRIMDLDYRVRAGVGLGLQWLDGVAYEGFGKVSFNQEAGISWVKERYEAGFDEDYATFRYAHHAIWDPEWIKNLHFVHNLEYLPDFEEWQDNYIIDADIGFTYDLIGAWQLMGKYEFDYKSKVAHGTKNTDTRYTLGLGYKW